MSTSTEASARTSADGEHLDDQRRQSGDRADAGEADRRDVEEIAAADAVASAPDVSETQRTVPQWP